MRLIHKVPFSSQEVESYRQLVFDNITRGLRYLLDAMEDMDLKVSEKNFPYLDLVDGARDIRDGEPFPLSFYIPLKSLWNDPNVQKAWGRGNEAALPEKFVDNFPPHHILTAGGTQFTILLFTSRPTIRSRVSTHGARYHQMPSTDDWDHRNDIYVARPRDAYGGRRWAEERAAEMDTLFPGCDEYSLPGQSQWV
jgi:hypothetical protein